MHTPTALLLLINTLLLQSSAAECGPGCVYVSVRVYMCVRLSPIHQGKSRFSASLLLHVGSWFSRPKPHVIYPATSPTNYSLHTAAENQQPLTFHTHTSTDAQKYGQRDKRVGGHINARHNARIVNNNQRICASNTCLC